ncbi:MAG: TldD/PmbA family protein [Candidatus Jettenia sp.]|uniref:Peptidase n=1 Tax=Candidatus Jettenia caeni TaxID=247490 RepID=I3ILW3_9BACT|nr:TldD/PmbA family protein [Candidatus Jettenia sp. AMX1]MBC6928116.1 TldD/PmbA family protein [Candidatus Jettenia sp.]WKZ14468.1 MAG: TldD/PmbA family protein [Candidatus Jettenia caeni]KAA0249472.1 MAG: TldD/PmbA family protein [Candidatus Jettenia sp. AMX1]MCE7879208.1 TldD/PmbA family protein [Candidatus Jettenia sp. AMX1]MCQ3925975.1 TldD/PmbA family protein [Candidatus Jettenia sp.]
MEKLIKNALKLAKADYAEIRIQEGVNTSVAYVGKELENIGENTIFGGCVRALFKGGWGFVAFNDIENLPRYVEMACEQARFVGTQESQLAPIPVIHDHVKAKVGIDPADISLTDKQAICNKYNSKILSSRQIQTSNVRYLDSHGTVHFANTDGSFIVQETIFCGISLLAMARDGMNVQQAYYSVGDLQGFSNVQNLEQNVEEVTKRAVDLLTAKPVTGGKYTVIIDPKLCGVFIHEAFGHLSEADFIYENAKMREIMVLGKRFGIDALSIIDDGSMAGEAGYNKYDHEGTPTQKTYLIKHGILTNRLHSRETAAKMHEQPTGNARAVNYAYGPIVRMTNTYMEPRDYTFEKMLSEVDNGIYAIGALGGQTNMEMFTFSAEEAYLIKNGKIQEKIRDVVLTGNVFETLMNIDAIGNDLHIHGGLGGCGKSGQSPLRVGDGGPHVRIQNVVIGGR